MLCTMLDSTTSAQPPTQWDASLRQAPLMATLLPVAAAILFAYAFWHIRAGSPDGAFIALTAAAGLLLVFVVCAPSRWVVLAFLLFMLTSHQFRSPITFPFGGVEWHPRELALLALALHGAIALLRGKLLIPQHAQPLSFALLLYGACFLTAMAQGILLDNGTRLIIAELRYPIFLLAFLPIALCIHHRADLYFLLRAMVLTTLLIALTAIAFLLYTEISGHIINVQNSLGEFVRRDFNGRLIQSIRPNGHHLFEVAVIILASLLGTRDLSTARRILYTALLLVFLVAIALTMMRTAYLALALGLAVLAWCYLPKKLQLLSLASAPFLAAAALAWFYGALDSAVPGATANLEVSLRSRFVEMAGAWDLFLAHPLLGSGLGSVFTAPGLVASQTLLSVREVEYQTIHNVWMYFLYKGGVVGFAFAFLGLGGIAFAGWRIAARQDDAWERHFAFGLFAAYLGQLLASLAMPRLTYPSGAVFVVMVAFAFLLLAQSKTSQTESPPTAA